MPSDRCTIANLRTIGKVGQRKLESTCVGVAGLGGVGGIAFELLVRAGVGRIRVADAGFFEESNANRQSLWSKETDGGKKTDAAMDFARQVNPRCTVLPFGDIAPANSAQFASGCSSAIDATDRAHSRIAVWRGCKKAGVPYIFASALGAKGMLTVFSRKKDFEKEFGLNGEKCRDFLSRDSQGATGSPSANQRPPDHRVAPCDHSLGPVANAIGCLAAQQALNIILGKKAAEFPEVISINAFSDKQAATHFF